MSDISITKARMIIRKALATGRELGLKPLSVVVLDAGGRIAAEPRLAMPGTLDTDSEPDRAILDAVVAAVRQAVERLSGPARRDDEAVQDAVRRAVRKVTAGQLAKKPVTEVHLVRL
jgi:ribonuclease J